MRHASCLVPSFAIATIAAAALAMPVPSAHAKPCLTQEEMNRDMDNAATAVANGGYMIWGPDGKFDLWMNEAYLKASGDPKVCPHT